MPETIEAKGSGRLALVTGASGKIGKHVVKELVQQGFRVRAMTSRSRPDQGATEGLEWRVKDFTTSIDFDEDVEGCDAVIHLAAEILQSARMPRVNVEATRALASASERAGVKVFCYTSSASVYGNSLSRTVTEDSPTLTPDEDVKSEYSAPDSLRAYGRSKLLGEIALREEARCGDYVIVRPTVVVDVDDVVRLGSLSHIRKSLMARRHAHYVYVADIADAVVWLVRRSLMGNGAPSRISIYNLAEDEFRECSYEAILRRLRRTTGQRKFSVVPAPAIADRLASSARFGNLPVRFGFGQMFFATDKLKNEGFRMRFGLEYLYCRTVSRILATER